MCYTHGVRATVVNSIRLDGQTLGTFTRNQQFMALVKGLARVRCRVMSRHLVANYAYNNVTSSGKLRDTRGKSNKFLHGTHMAVHVVRPYDKTDYNHLRVDNTSDHR